MVVVIHDNIKVLSILNDDLKPIAFVIKTNETLSKAIMTIAENFKKELLIWCHKNLLQSINIKAFTTVFHHKHILATFNTDSSYYLSNKIEFLERSICLKFSKNKTYGTYLMSAQIGAIYSETLLSLKKDYNLKQSFIYNLNSIAKKYQNNGLFCYSEPKLLQNNYKKIKEPLITNANFFVFVRQHYKLVWVCFMLIALQWFNKQFLLIPFLKSWLYTFKSRKTELNEVKVVSKKQVIKSKNIDVVIPTIGRKKYLLDVLNDLANQTILPKQVIIVEQNTDKKASSELDYLTNKEWPFQITHKFTTVLGVCNARNQALKELKNDWVFFADDDIRFRATLFEESFQTLKKYGVFALNYSCLLVNQKQTYFNTGQTFIFGSGSSFVSAKIANQVNFNEEFEFGFGEDTDYGANIRQLGFDVVFTANINIDHLKAPVGGFRQPITKLWDKDQLQPKPSPTMMLLYKKKFTTNQLKGYKLFLFFKMYGNKNPLRLRSHINEFKKRWNKSVFYATNLVRN